MRAALTRASGPPLQSSTISSGRAPSWSTWAVRAQAYQPAHVRIIRLVLPDPDAPRTTWCRPIDPYGTVSVGASGARWRGWSRAHHDPSMPISQGTVPGAVMRARAVRACLHHWRASKMTGAVAVFPEMPVSMA